MFRRTLNPPRNLLQFDLVVQPQADGSPSFQFEPLVVISLPPHGALAGEFFENPGVLYYYNARFYDPTLGRFMTEDPARSGGNWYVYADSEPLSGIDPTGLRTYFINGIDNPVTDRPPAYATAFGDKLIERGVKDVRLIQVFKNKPDQNGIIQGVSEVKDEMFGKNVYSSRIAEIVKKDLATKPLTEEEQLNILVTAAEANSR